MGSFVGFYWTFPVRWAGFLDLPDDVARAAQASRTVAYQRALVRRFVDWENGRLAHEVVAMEVSPDRGTAAIAGDVARAGHLCREMAATLAHVDFHRNGGWRPHPVLAEALATLRRSGVPTVGLDAEEIVLDGQRFDPADHFSMWRVRDAEERARRRQDVPAALATALSEAGPRTQPRVHVRREPPARRLHEARGTLAPTRAEIGDDLDRADVPGLLVQGQGDAPDHGVGIALGLEPPDDVAKDRRQHPRGRVGQIVDVDQERLDVGRAAAHAAGPPDQVRVR